jgi:hypothetical protein
LGKPLDEIDELTNAKRLLEKCVGTDLVGTRVLFETIARARDETGNAARLRMSTDLAHDFVPTDVGQKKVDDDEVYRLAIRFKEVRESDAPLAKRRDTNLHLPTQLRRDQREKIRVVVDENHVEHVKPLSSPPHA